MQDDFDSFQGVLDKTPKQIDQMLKKLQEMKIGAEPDESADYWEERDQINKQTDQLQDLKAKFNQLDQDR